MKKTKIMIVGMGDLAWWVLEFLCRTPGPFEVITADYDDDMGAKRTNSAMLSSYQMGYDPSVKFVRVDLNDIEATSNTLSDVKPDIIYNSATLQSWWVLAELPKPAYEALDKARYGPWLPMHLLLTYKLMQAVKKSDISTMVVNAAFPDVVNPVLQEVGLAPLIGIGNVDNLIPSLTLLAAAQLNVHPRRVQPYILAPHYVSYFIPRYGNSGGAEIFLKITLDDQDVTQRIDVPTLLNGVSTAYKRPGGRGAHPLVASSVVKIVVSLMNNTGTLCHAPGPNGLPGGYPVRVSSHGVEVVVPEGLTLEECVRINEEAQKFEGIEKINSDGSVIFSNNSWGIMKDLLGYDCKTMQLEECESRVKELDRKFKEYAAKF